VLHNKKGSKERQRGERIVGMENREVEEAGSQAIDKETMERKLQSIRRVADIKRDIIAIWRPWSADGLGWRDQRIDA